MNEEELFPVPLKRESWSYNDIIGRNPIQPWTPVLTFQTPGDLTVAYTFQQGSWFRMGRTVFYDFSIVTSTFTHTTAALDLRITGLPFMSENVTGRIPQGCGAWAGITKAGYTDLFYDVNPNTAYLSPTMSGSGQLWVTVRPADMPTGGTVKLIGTGRYNAAV